MRALKLFLISAVVIFLLLTGFSLLLPSHVRVSRAINIAAPAQSIRPYMSDLREWKQWNKLLADSSITIGSVDSSIIKTNRFDIILLTVGQDSVSTRWEQPNGKVFTGSFSLIPSGDTTIVQWYFDFHLRWYPWEKFASIIYDDRMGPGMENSLTQLKGLVETSP
jgi:hypothetical protein